MAQGTVTQSMREKAEHLAEQAPTWARGRSKVDGSNFYLVPASNGQAHYTNSAGCTCASFRHRGACSHQLACEILARRSDAAIVARIVPLVRYRELFGED